MHNQKQEKWRLKLKCRLKTPETYFGGICLWAFTIIVQPIRNSFMEHTLQNTVVAGCLQLVTYI